MDGVYNMPKSTTFSNDLVALIFNGTTIASLAVNITGGAATNLYLALHTADPGVGGSQANNETTYTNYDRVAVSRSAASGWTVALGVATNVALIQFPQCGAVGATLTHVSVGTTAGTGVAGKVLYAGALNSSLAVANLIQPQFSAAALTVTEA